MSRCGGATNALTSIAVAVDTSTPLPMIKLSYGGPRGRRKCETGHGRPEMDAYAGAIPVRPARCPLDGRREEE